MTDLREHLVQQVAYNRWAWERVIPSVAKLDEQDYFAERAVFWGSIHGVLVHALSAEWIWLQRSKGISPTTLFEPAVFPNFAAWHDFWDANQRDLEQFITDADLARQVHYKNTKGIPHQAQQANILQHVLMHSMEHRGQITPVLYNVGVPTKPLDFVYFFLGQQ